MMYRVIATVMLLAALAAVVYLASDVEQTSSTPSATPSADQNALKNLNVN